ncbi:MAG: 4Fe-4S dicluster domain-containing protein [Coriobacteriales bacterium]|nr:4Fe-4S dicluster domain-containing protein [Coriobacteriales bacterium]
MARMGMLVDIARCAGCQGCVVACQMQNNQSPGVTWGYVDRCEWGEYPQAGAAYLPHFCMQCDDPACVTVCPTGASVKGEDGVTLVDYEICIGCGQCVAACPYGGRHLNLNGDKGYFDAPLAPYQTEGIQRTNVAEKCLFCHDLVAEGGQPACVLNCTGKARTFGDVDDPSSAIALKLAEGKATRVGATGFYYVQPAGMPANMIDSKVLVGAPTLPTDPQEPAAPTEQAGGINPVVIGGAAVVVAAAAVGGGVAYSNKKKKAAAEAGGTSDEK